MKLLCLAAALVALLGAGAPTPAPAAQREVTFTSVDGSVLAGTLSWPADLDEGQQVPGFVLIGGSGPHDRDETIGANKPFADLARALNAAGFAVLRYDKRGSGASSNLTAPAQLTRQNYIDDAEAAVKTLAADPHVNQERIFLIGHSEGGELAMAVAIALGVQVRGLVLLAPLPIPYADVIKEQLARLPATTRVAAQEQLSAAQTFLNSYAAIDPRVEITKVTQPVLVLHGSKDMQVTDDDMAGFVAAAHAANKPFIYGELGGDNHLFATLPGDTPSTGVEYFAPHPLDDRVVAAIVAWMRDQ